LLLTASASPEKAAQFVAADLDPDHHPPRRYLNSHSASRTARKSLLPEVVKPFSWNAAALLNH